MKKLLLVLVFALSALFGADVSVQEYKKTFEQFSNEELIKMMIDSDDNLPNRLDDMTILNTIELVDNDTIGYRCILNNTNDVKFETFSKEQKKVFLDVIKKQVGEELCGNNVTMAMLDRGIKFGYFYKLENSQNFAKFILSRSDCK